MLRGQLILSLFVLINGCVYCQLDQGHVNEGTTHTKQQRLSPKVHFGNSWRRKVFGGDLEVPTVTSNSIFPTNLTGKSVAYLEDVATRDGKCMEFILTPIE